MAKQSVTPLDLGTVYGLLTQARMLAGEIVGSLDVELDTVDRAVEIAAKIREASYALGLATT